MRLRLFGALRRKISGDGFGTIASESKNGFVEMSFTSSLPRARLHRATLAKHSDAKTPKFRSPSDISEIRNQINGRRL
jgi:hypothetical protein